MLFFHVDGRGLFLLGLTVIGPLIAGAVIAAIAAAGHLHAVSRDAARAEGLAIEAEPADEQARSITA